jgi:magnesium-transporting ATPase (P-type)
MNVVLFTALGASFGLQEWVKGGVLLFVIFTNTFIGFFQEYRAEKTMDALRKLASPTARVMRDGNIEVIPAWALVPGDIVFLIFLIFCVSLSSYNQGF